jgi:hypothetical protein
MVGETKKWNKILIGNNFLNFQDRHKEFSVTRNYHVTDPESCP